MKKGLLATKKKLQNQLNAIAKQEEKELIEKNHPIFKAKFEGKYFKTINSYNSTDKGWWLYIKILEIKPSDVYNSIGNEVTASYHGWSFQTTCYNEIIIDKEKNGYVHSIDMEITEDEFYTAYNKMIASIDKLK